MDNLSVFRGAIVRFKIERLGGNQAMANAISSCSHCAEVGKTRKRDFSPQAWTVLVLWSEIQKSTVDQALCDNCYDELREVLIDRADEIENAIAAGEPAKVAAAVSGKSAARKSTAARPKVCKAG
jgi:hypothetical protein